MTKVEWRGIAAAIASLWPNAGLTAPTVAMWFEVLRDDEAEPIRKAVMDLHVSGREFPPTAGELHQEAKRAEGPYTGPSCTCHVDGLRSCKSNGHPSEFLERQRIRDQACGLVDEAVRRGELINHHAYSGYLGEAMGERLIQHWYWANEDAGRAIQDPGDSEGKPTIVPGGSRRRRPATSGDSQAVREAGLAGVIRQLRGASPEDPGDGGQVA